MQVEEGADGGGMCVYVCGGAEVCVGAEVVLVECVRVVVEAGGSKAVRARFLGRCRRLWACSSSSSSSSFDSNVVLAVCETEPGFHKCAFSSHAF